MAAKLRHKGPLKLKSTVLLKLASNEIASKDTKTAGNRSNMYIMYGKAFFLNPKKNTPNIMKNITAYFPVS